MQNNQPKKVKSFRLSEDVIAKLTTLHFHYLSDLQRAGFRNSFSVANVIEKLVNEKFDELGLGLPPKGPQVKLASPAFVKTIRIKGEK